MYNLYFSIFMYVCKYVLYVLNLPKTLSPETYFNLIIPPTPHPKPRNASFNALSYKPYEGRPPKAPAKKVGAS